MLLSDQSFHANKLGHPYGGILQVELACGGNTHV
jgi:hypothetical protein